MSDSKPTAFVAAADRAARRRAGRTPAGPADPEAELLGRPTPRRAEVLRALVEAEEFISAQLLYTRMVQAGSRVGLSTVYRTLAALAQAGGADVVRDAGGERFFRYRPGPFHRHYLICRECGLSRPVDSVAIEAWADEVTRSSGFTDVHHTVELTGTCADCASTAPLRH